MSIEAMKHGRLFTINWMNSIEKDCHMTCFFSFEKAMLMRIFFFAWMIGSIVGNDALMDKLRAELEQSKIGGKDSVMPFLCKMLPSKEFIKEADDEDFFSLILYELGFGVLGVKPDSWAAKYQTNPRRPPSCFSALYSAATSDVTKSTLAISRRIIARCCNSNQDL